MFAAALPSFSRISKAGFPMARISGSPPPQPLGPRWRFRFRRLSLHFAAHPLVGEGDNSFERHGVSKREMSLSVDGSGKNMKHRALLIRFLMVWPVIASAAASAREIPRT